MSGFRITQGQGFHITFENGYTVSVQFGEGNYCSNRRLFSAESLLKTMYLHEVNTKCDDAEVAVINPDNELMHLPQFEGDVVGGHYSPEKVLELLNWAKEQK